MKRLTLCADDFAYTQAVSDGIIALAQNKRINAISCMSTRPLWPTHAPKLTHLADCSVGLHLNLTEEATPQSHTLLIAKAYVGALSYSKIYKNIEQQFDIFCEHHNALPDFLDGHQHVHQLPTVRRALTDFYKKHLCDTGCAIRLSANPMFRMLKLPFVIKQSIIYGSGYSGLRSRLRKNSIPHNTSFAGIYPFNTTAYRALFQKFLAFSQDGGLIMCHPGLKTTDKAADPLYLSRYHELSYFQSDAFLQDLSAHDACLLKP
jgi:chitin disaccharide deacetylase